MDRMDLHNASVNEQAARQGLCGHTHLATGRVCLREHRHSGNCTLDDPAELSSTAMDTGRTAHEL